MSTPSSVTTNLDDYAPGATAIITASGFDSGSTVTFSVQHVSGPGVDGVYGTVDDDVTILGGDGHDAWTVVDGGAGDLDGLQNGMVVTSWYVNPDDSLDARFLLSATTADGWLATNTFTDKAVPPADPGTFNGTIVQSYTTAGSTGTGVISSFLRVQADGYEAGYNTDGRPLQFQENTSLSFTHSITLAQVPKVTMDGTQYYVFNLDLNENNNGDSPLITLQNFKIFGSSVSDLANMDTSTKLFPTSSATLLYELDGGGNTSVDLTDWNSGSGTGDYVVYIPVAGVNGNPGFTGLAPSTFIYVYTEFGQQGDSGNSSEGGFEEWFVVTQSTPEMAIDKTFVNVTGGNGNDVADFAGDVLNYTVTVINTGNVELTGVTIADPLTGQAISGVTLAVGESKTYTTSYTLTQDDIDNWGGGDGDIDNTATADSNETDPVSDLVAVPVQQNPALSIDKDAVLADEGEAADEAGDVINYTITVRNTGNQTLTGVEVTDTLLSASPLVLDSGDTDEDGKLDVDETWIYTGSHTVTQDEIDAGGTIDNTATADSAETEPSDDSASVPVDQNPALSIDKDAVLADEGEAADEAGDVINYTITVRNTGNQTLTGVEVTDTLLSASPLVLDSGDTDEDGKLDVDEAWIYTGSHTVTQDEIDAGGTIDNTATADSAETEPSDDSASVPVDQNPSLEIVKEADEGQVADVEGEKLTYTITVENTGNQTLTGVAVTDPNADADSIVRGQDVEGDNDNLLEVGEKWLYTAAHTVTQAEIDSNGGDDGDIDNTATADSNESDPDTDDASVPVDQNPAISIAKITKIGTSEGDNLTGVHAGEDVLWRYTVTNSGNTALSNVYVTDDNGTPGVTADDFTLTKTSGYVSGDADGDGKLDVGEEWVFEKTGTAIAGTYENTGTVYGTSGESEVSDSDDSSYTATVPSALIAPTGTTAYQYISGTAMSFQEYYKDQGGVIQYGVKGGKINQTNPGVFFYFTGASGDIQDGDNDGKIEKITVLIDQSEDSSNSTTTPAFKPLNNSNVQLYKVIDSGADGTPDGIVNSYDTLQSVKLATNSIKVDPVTGDVTVSFMPDAEGSMYVLSVKYDTTKAVGGMVGTDPSQWPTVTYDFKTWVNGSYVETYEGGIDLAPKSVNTMMLDGDAGDGARGIKAAQAKAVYKAALKFWSNEGFDVSSLKKGTVEIADLGKYGDDWMLGMEQDGHITIDNDAAGHGWSLGIGAVAPNKVDLFSVLVHEIGHVLGEGDDDMGAMLAVGERELPMSHDDASPLPLPATLFGVVGAAHAPTETHFG